MTLLNNEHGGKHRNGEYAEDFWLLEVTNRHFRMDLQRHILAHIVQYFFIVLKILGQIFGIFIKKYDLILVKFI